MRLSSLILLLLFFVSLLSCDYNYSKIEKGWWKYGEGHHLGDRLDIGKSHQVSNDTIYAKDIAIATIKLYHRRTMIIKDIGSNKTGRYHHKY